MYNYLLHKTAVCKLYSTIFINSKKNKLVVDDTFANKIIPKNENDRR